MRAPRATRSAVVLLLIELAVASPARAESPALRISTYPGLDVAAQGTDGRRVFALSGTRQIDLRVEARVGGSHQDVTSTCSFTPVSPLVTIRSGGSISIAAAPHRTIAAVVVECPAGREIVGFALSASGAE